MHWVSKRLLPMVVVYLLLCCQCIWSAKLVSFGDYRSGQLGDGSSFFYRTPTLIETSNYLLSNETIVDIATGEFFSVFITSSNHIVVVGSLGIEPEEVYDTSQIQRKFVIPSTEFPKQICTGTKYALILTQQGNVYRYGKIGNYSSIEEAYENFSPLSLLTNIQQISCGSAHALLLQKSTVTTPTKNYENNVFCLGQNDVGNCGLGYSSSTPIVVPTQIIFNMSILGSSVRGVAVTYVSAGGDHSSVTFSAFSQRQQIGLAYFFGSNRMGQFGMSWLELTDFYSPVLFQIATEYGLKYALEFVSTDLPFVFCGFQRTCLLNGYQILCFGINRNGELGTGSADPIIVEPSYSIINVYFTRLYDIVFGRYTTYFLIDDGVVYATGSNKYGELSLSSNTPSINVPQQIEIKVSSTKLLDKKNLKIAKIVAAHHHILFMTSESQVYALGFNDNFQMALKDLGMIDFAKNFLETDLQLISAGYQHAIGINNIPALFGWGEGSVGQLGNGNVLSSQATPTVVGVKGSLKSAAFKDLQAGDSFSMVLTEDGTVWTFGINEARQLGNGVTEEYKGIPIPTFLKQVTAICAGEKFAAAILQGDMYQWGTVIPQSIPNLIPSRIGWTRGGMPLQKITCGARHALLLTNTSQLLAFGQNTNYQTGSDAGYQSIALQPPIPVPFFEKFPVDQIASGYAHSIVLLKNGSLYAFGNNKYGQLGIGTVGEDKVLPTLIPFSLPSDDAIKIIASKVNHTLLVTKKGRLFGFGKNYRGQLGIKVTAETRIIPEPTEIVFDLTNQLSMFYHQMDIQNITVGAEFSLVIILPLLNRVLVTILLTFLILVTILLFIGLAIILFIAFWVQQAVLRKRWEEFDEMSFALEHRNTENTFQFQQNLFQLRFEDLKDVVEIRASAGSGAVLFKAKWDNEIVCVKVFRTSLYSDELFLEDFQHEVQLLSSLNHNNIVHMYGACKKDTKLGIVTEFCEYGSLADVIKRQTLKFSFDDKVRILLDTAKGMRFLHQKGVIHRDLKCENILIDGNRNAKIGDFGLSKIVHRAKQRMTQHVGTSFYMSPEVTLGEAYNEKCDVFSFSIIMFELYTDTLDPYGEENRFNQTIQLQVANNSTFRPQFPSHVKVPMEHEFYVDLMSMCWKRDPQMRPSFQIIVQQLENHLKTNASSKWFPSHVPRHSLEERRTSQHEKL